MSGLVINTNLAAKQGLNNLRLNNLSIGRSMERLSSGLRINKGADDPSGLAISQGMQARIRSTSVAMQNVQDNINMLRTAEGGLNEITQMVHRVHDLVIRGANEATLTTADRQRIQDEIDSLVDGINQIGIATRYNTKAITSSSEDFNKIEWVEGVNLTVNDWAGPNPPSTGPGDPAYDEMRAGVLSMIESAAYRVYGRLGLGPAAGASLTVTFTDINADGQGNVIATGGGAAGAMTMDIDVYHFLDPDGALAGRETIGYDNTVHMFTPELILAHEMTHAILVGNGIAGSAWGQEMCATYVSGEGDLRIDGNEAAVLAAVGGALTSVPASSFEYAECYLAGQYIQEQHGAERFKDICLRVQGGMDWDAALVSALSYTAFADFEAEADTFATGYVNGGRDNSVERAGLGWTLDSPAFFNRTYNKGQVGPDNGGNYNIDVATPWITAGAADYLCFANVTSTVRAQNSLTSCNRAKEIVHAASTLIGVQERRLNHIMDDLEAEHINASAARSRISDADMAVEITDFTKSQITTQSTTAMIAQANTSGDAVLTLLDSAMGV